MSAYVLFIVSLLGLCAASLSAFIVAFRKRSLPLLVFVPLIAFCGSFIYFSYTSVLGYPVEMEWHQLPSKISVIYFRVEKNSITLWLLEDKNTKLVKLPYDDKAENDLEAQREKMGQGTPVNFRKLGQNGEGQDGEDGEQGEANGQTKGRSGARGMAQKRAAGRDSKNGDTEGRGGWRYRVESYGEPIPGGTLPPK